MSFVKEFKEFAIKGNAVDLAVGVIIGAAFGKIIDGLINDIIMPLVAAIVGKPDFSNIFWAIGKGADQIPKGASLADARKVAPDASIFAYGDFITVAINFFLLALVIFIMVKAINSMKKKEAAAPAPIPEPSAEEKLLTEIRDVLKSK